MYYNPKSRSITMKRVIPTQVISFQKSHFSTTANTDRTLIWGKGWVSRNVNFDANCIDGVGNKVNVKNKEKLTVAHM